MAAQLAAQPFALMPAMVGGNLPIDYTTRSGQSLFNNGIAPLPFTFDGKPEYRPFVTRPVPMDGTTS